MHEDFCIKLGLPFDINQEVLTPGNYKSLISLSHIFPWKQYAKNKAHRLYQDVFVNNNPQFVEWLDQRGLKVDEPLYFIKHGNTSHNETIHIDRKKRHIVLLILLGGPDSTMIWYDKDMTTQTEWDVLTKINPNNVIARHEEQLTLRDVYMARVDVPHSIGTVTLRHSLSIGLQYKDETRGEFQWEDAKQLFSSVFI